MKSELSAENSNSLHFKEKKLLRYVRYSYAIADIVSVYIVECICVRAEINVKSPIVGLLSRNVHTYMDTDGDILGPIRRADLETDAIYWGCGEVEANVLLLKPKTWATVC